MSNGFVRRTRIILLHTEPEESRRAGLCDQRGESKKDCAVA